MTRTENALRPHDHVPGALDHAPPHLLLAVAPDDRIAGVGDLDLEHA